MTRRTTTAALLSATLLMGGGLALGFAGSAAAADDPGATPAALPVLGLNPAAPVADSALEVTGTDCTPTTDPITNASVPSSVSVTISGPAGFDTTTVSGIVPGTDGTWSSNTVKTITLGDAGDYTVSASCTQTLAALPLSTAYPNSTFTAAAAPTTPPANPAVIVSPTSVAPGGPVSIGGTGFSGAGNATVNLTGFTAKSATVTDGSFSGVSFAIPASQAGGTINGTVTTDNNLSEDFTVTVTSNTSVDGTVPGGNTTTTTTAPTTSAAGTSSGTSGTTSRATAPVVGSSKPRLANTGRDTVWPGVAGGVLVLTGAGLLWFGRRREDGEVAAA